MGSGASTSSGAPHAVTNKANIVENDEKEITGLRKILNLGHTFAHAFEVESNYKLKHGEAVIGGIFCALFHQTMAINLEQDTFIPVALLAGCSL